MNDASGLLIPLLQQWPKDPDDAPLADQRALKGPQVLPSRFPMALLMRSQKALGHDSSLPIIPLGAPKGHKRPSEARFKGLRSTLLL